MILALRFQIDMRIEVGKIKKKISLEFFFGLYFSYNIGVYKQF